MESKFYPLSGSTLIFVKNTPQKAANLAVRLILAARMGFIESFGVLDQHQKNINFLQRLRLQYYS